MLAIVLAAAAVVLLVSYLLGNRYQLVSSGKLVYKLDRFTGRTTLSYGDEERSVEQQRERKAEPANPLDLRQPTTTPPRAVVPLAAEADADLLRKAIEIAQASEGLVEQHRKEEKWRLRPGSSDFISTQVYLTRAVVRAWLEDQTGALTVAGWSAERVSEGIYLVSMTVERAGSTDDGFFFEVQLDARLTRFVNSDSALCAKYALSPDPRVVGWLRFYQGSSKVDPYTE